MVAGGLHISRGLRGSDLCFEKKHHLGCLRGQRMDGEEAVDVAGPARLLHWSVWEIGGGGGPELAVAAVVLLRGCWFWKCDGCLWFLRYQSCGALHGHLVYLSVGQHKATEAQR